MLQVVDAIDYLHGTGVAHTDLKLENVVRVCEDGDRVQVIDLGMAARIVTAAGAIQPRSWACVSVLRSLNRLILLCASTYGRACVFSASLGS